MRAFTASVWLQLAVLRNSHGDLLALTTVPLFAAIFLSILKHAGRTDLLGYAVLAPAVIAMLGMAIATSGEIIVVARHAGILELMMVTCTPLPTVVFARVATVTVISLVAVGESWLVALLLFGVAVPVAHPALFIATFTATAIAMAGAATMMSALFVLFRSARTFQNSVSYPLYLLGGALVPVALLPGWLQPLSRLVFLSWATDLLRDSISTAPVRAVPSRLTMVLLLGGAGYTAGYFLIRWVVERARAAGNAGNP